MHLFEKDLDRQIAIVAEIGVNHEGDPEKAMELVRLAAEAGADAVKFQSYSPSRYVSAMDAERFERVGRFALDEATHRRLAAEAAEQGICFFSTAVSEDWVPLLAELGPAVKIASGDLTFEPVIRAAAASGKPVIISTGLGTPEEIDRSVAWFADELGATPLRDRLVLMHCSVAYPTPIDEANVLSVNWLKERFGVHAGFSNHVIGPDACYAAVAQGADILEVHFTDRKEGRSFRDHALSMEPSDLAELVERTPRIRQSLGVLGKRQQPAELANLSAARKGIVAARDLAAGTVLSAEDIMYARPVVEFASTEIGRVLGQTLTAAVTAGHPIPRDALAD